MSSTGNDIVAFAATDRVRTCQPRFYGRILSADELELQDTARLDFSAFVWLLWSIKESVYKFKSRSDHELVFAPLKIAVSRLVCGNGSREGKISYLGSTLFSRSFVNEDTIMTVVSEEDDFAHTRWGMNFVDGVDYARQSARVRTFALQSLSAEFPGADLRIVRTPDGPPELMDGERRLDVPVSLAHHDRWVAWSFRLPSNSSPYKKSAAN